MTNGYNGTIATSAVQIVNHGPQSARWNLVILGEGYTQNELTKYHTDINTILSALQAKAPFNELWPCINVFRVNVTSTDSFLNARVGTTQRTYYNSYFTNATSGRVAFHMDESRANEDGKRLVPEAHMVLVLVNFTAWTIGHAGAPAVVSVQRPCITIHEIGHNLGGLDDEYHLGNGSYATGTEPRGPNVTFNSDRNTIKWADLVNPLTPMPSSCNAGSTVCNVPATPITTPGIVGAFEGAYYYQFGSYRPTLECCMSADEPPFCPVCNRALRQALAPFKPDATVTTAEYVIDSPNVSSNYKKVIRLKGDFGIAVLYFVPEGIALGANGKRANQSHYDVYYPMSAWSQCVDLLRNEKPIYFIYDMLSNTAAITTSDEPVGEAER